MQKYILKRIFLMIPTFFGSTFLVYVILSFVPGGPFQKAIMQIKYSQMNLGKDAGVSQNNSQNLSPEIIDQLKKQYGLDKPLLQRYLIWLGFMKRAEKEKEVSAPYTFREDWDYVYTESAIYTIQRWIKVVKTGNNYEVYESGMGTDFKFSDEFDELPDFPEIIDWEKSQHWKVKSQTDEKIKLVKEKRSGILTLDFGNSYVYDEPVLKLIKDRIHISGYFGIIGFILTYIICIPLGILKAIKHGSKFDVFSSILIFMGYSIPGYVLGSVLLVLFGGGSFFDFLPLGGFVSDDWDKLSFIGKIKDLILHTILPVISYSIGSFATLTILMKNSIIENLSQDYVRTAHAKGLNKKRIILVHVLRNSLIPLATDIGGLIGIFLAGSYFIEKVFNIDGIGMLSFVSIMSADYPVVMGFLVINTIILLLGNLISDIVYALIDPRIRFK
ncbi:MAG: binding-protein-dependent transport system inner membrane component [uncultured bacterium]|nr:MAG: binding-protein-dependent transport system inner membrane component [uncultured bacterium]